MHEITVTYMLEDEDYSRLENIKELYQEQRLKYQEQGMDLPPEKIFESIMCSGSKYDIDRKLKFHEWKLGLREYFS